MNSKFSPLIIAILLLLAPNLPLVLATSTGDSSGTVGVSNVTPTIATPSWAQDGQQIDVDALYKVGWTIGDKNTLADLNVVTIKLWDSGTVAEGGADNAVNHYTYTWTEATGVWAEVGPDGAGSHLITANCSAPSVKTGGSYAFVLGFKLAKSAQKTSSATWHIKVIVTDDGSNSANRDSETFGVNIYKAITIDDPTHSWSSLTPGDANQVLALPVDAKIDFTVTCNDVYNIQVKGTTPTSGGDTIPVGQIAVHKDTLGSASALTTSYANVGGLTSLPAGDSVSRSLKLWITVPNPQKAGSYTYTLSIQVN